MGKEQIKAAGLYSNGNAGSLSFETFPYQTEMTNPSSVNPVTDSAAAATAMATGQKVFNGVISLAMPGFGNKRATILEIAKQRNKSTGLVTTAYLTHATPAAFGAHAIARERHKKIASDYLNHSRPNVLFGGGGHGLSPESLEKAGYLVSETSEELKGLNSTEASHFSGHFGTDHIPYMYDGTGDLPELSDMALKALEILETDPDGFFLMIEAGRIDHAGHANDLIRNIYETLELSDTVEQVLSWAEGRDDTLIIVTADHETGGLQVVEEKGAGKLPEVTWSTDRHTGVNVPVYLWGLGADRLSLEIEDNTDIFNSLIE